MGANKVLFGFCNTPGRAINPDVLCESGTVGAICRLKTGLLGWGGALENSSYPGPGVGAVSLSAALSRPELLAWRKGWM